jgi:lysozyme
MADPAGILFGLDTSHHQGDNPDFARARAEGLQYVIFKATEGNGFVDRKFHGNVGRAIAAGLLVAAYHYQRSGISAAAQVEHIKRVVPLGMPVIPDVEANSGGVDLTREIVRLLRAAGYPVPLVYIPRWYWQQLGRPSLAGLPPLWSSRYPDNVGDSIVNEYRDVPASYWEGYGGLEVKLLQFTSSGRAAGYGPLDGNAFRGTRAQFAALLGGGQPEPEDPDEEEDDMTVSYSQSVMPPLLGDNEAYRDSIEFGFEIGPGSDHAKRGYVTVSARWGTVHVRAWGSAKKDADVRGDLLVDLPEETTSGEKVRLSEFTIDADESYTWKLPENFNSIGFDFWRLTSNTNAPKPSLGFTLWGK